MKKQNVTLANLHVLVWRTPYPPHTLHTWYLIPNYYSLSHVWLNGLNVLAEGWHSHLKVEFLEKPPDMPAIF